MYVYVHVCTYVCVTLQKLSEYSFYIYSFRTAQELCLSVNLLCLSCLAFNTPFCLKMFPLIIKLRKCCFIQLCLFLYSLCEYSEQLLNLYQVELEVQNLVSMSLYIFLIFSLEHNLVIDFSTFYLDYRSVMGLTIDFAILPINLLFKTCIFNFRHYLFLFLQHLLYT